MLFFPHCRAQQRHLPIYLPADALQVIPAHLESADLSEGEAAMQTAGSEEEAPSQNMQVLMDPVPRILACDKSLVQPVWLGADSLPWLRAATAGTSSSVVLCKSCKSSYPVLQVLLPRPVPNLCPCQLTPRSQKRACLIAVHRNGILIWTPSDSSRSLGCSSLTRTAPTPEWIVIEGKEFFLFV